MYSYIVILNHYSLFKHSSIIHWIAVNKHVQLYVADIVLCEICTDTLSNYIWKWKLISSYSDWIVLLPFYLIRKKSPNEELRNQLCTEKNLDMFQYKASEQTFSNVFWNVYSHTYATNYCYIFLFSISKIIDDYVWNCKKKNSCDSCKKTHQHSNYSVYTCIYDPLMISSNKITDYP